MNGIFHKIMNKLGRYRLIQDRISGDNYMHRYYLFLKDRKKFPFNLTLHKIVKSDEPVMHDHPWAYMTIILKGGYWEHTPRFNEDKSQMEDVRRWRGPGSVIIRRSKEFHWLELDEEKPVTTLFFMGQQVRDWGFWKDKWVQNEEYLQKRLNDARQ